LFCGAGSAAVGVARQLMEYFRVEGGISEEEARRQFWLVDSKGLVTLDRGDKLVNHKIYFARDDNGSVQYSTMKDVINYVKPTALIGLSSQRDNFHPEILEMMGTLNERPIVFPLSNPSTNAECNFENAMLYTGNRVVFASGTAFAPYTIPETSQVRVPGQGNNMYIFPGLGLGAILVRAKHVSDSMIYASSMALANSLTAEELHNGDLYPKLTRIRDVSIDVAAAVMRQAIDEGLARDTEAIKLFDAAKKLPGAEGTLKIREWVKHKMWSPFQEEAGWVVDASSSGVKQKRVW